MEGVEKNPFMRHQCRPKMATKKKVEAIASSSMTSELLKKMAEEQQANKEKEANSGSNNGKEGPGENGDDVTDGEPAKKKAKKADEVEVKGKEDLFSYHDFDIDIPGKFQIPIDGGKIF